MATWRHPRTLRKEVRSLHSTPAVPGVWRGLSIDEQALSIPSTGVLDRGKEPVCRGLRETPAGAGICPPGPRLA